MKDRKVLIFARWTISSHLNVLTCQFHSVLVCFELPGLIGSTKAVGNGRRFSTVVLVWCSQFICDFKCMPADIS